MARSLYPTHRPVEPLPDDMCRMLSDVDNADALRGETLRHVERLAREAQQERRDYIGMFIIVMVVAVLVVSL